MQAKNLWGREMAEVRSMPNLLGPLYRITRPDGRVSYTMNWRGVYNWGTWGRGMLFSSELEEYIKELSSEDYDRFLEIESALEKLGKEASEEETDPLYKELLELCGYKCQKR